MKTFYNSTITFIKSFLVIAIILFVYFSASAQTNYPMGIKDASNGYHHTLVISKADSLYTFGANSSGQIGDGTNGHVLSPTPFGVKVIGVAGGYDFSFYIKPDSTLMGTGNNKNGQLGIGNNNSVNTWTAINLPSTVHFKQVEASADHTVAVTGNGNVYAWGANSKGAIGDGTTTDRNSPVQVQKASGGFLTNIIKVSAGSGANDMGKQAHSLALAADGTVWAWGYNDLGAIGDNTTTTRLKAVQVAGIGGSGYLTGAIDITLSGNSAYALLSNGTVVSWGANVHGQLGNGTTTGRSYPDYVKVNTTTNISNISQISASGAATDQDYCAMLKSSDSSVWNVGDNTYGQCGTGNLIDQTYAVQNTPALGEKFYKVIAHGEFLLAFGTDTLGKYCFTGHQFGGSFGDGTINNDRIMTATCLTAPGGLPVSLTSFTGKRADENTVVLHWTTETELSNDRFEVEYSTDGGEDFYVIGTVKGKGTSFTSNDYQFVQKGADNSVTGYYRLKQIDFNGGYEYHNIIAVKPSTTKSNLYAYPNPTKGTLNVSLTEETNTDYTISIMDQSGRVVMVKEGHIFNAPVSEKFDLNSFDRGFYFVTITTSFGTTIEKIAKQ